MSSGGDGLGAAQLAAQLSAQPSRVDPNLGRTNISASAFDEIMNAPSFGASRFLSGPLSMSDLFPAPVNPPGLPSGSEGINPYVGEVAAQFLGNGQRNQFRNALGGFGVPNASLLNPGLPDTSSVVLPDRPNLMSLLGGRQ